jgi:hypothetical protein
MASNWKTRIGCALLPALLLAGCYKHAENAGAGAQAVPPNYRQLVVTALAAKIDVKEFRDPKISAAVERNVSEFGFGVRPSVCVSAVPNRGRGPFPAWIVVFQDGKVANVFEPSIALGCRGLDWSPFPELMDRRT